jgi:hypothetical protein
MVIKTPRELCEDCNKSYGNGCPVWPPIKLTLECIEFFPLNKDNRKIIND